MYRLTYFLPPGKLFHIDFGYILGRDPKPLPPPMKLSKEMVEGMGGMQSEQYQEFRKQCYTAFLHLRRSDADTDLIAAKQLILFIPTGVKREENIFS